MSGTRQVWETAPEDRAMEHPCLRETWTICKKRGLGYPLNHKRFNDNGLYWFVLRATGHA